MEIYCLQRAVIMFKITSFSPFAVQDLGNNFFEVDSLHSKKGIQK